ncbi:MAG: 7-cyano-7-deazaguanine synthase [Candidatus Nanohaloarchaea archaeon]|nr:7-cyano-7-deazaguanine synthase [Candidatus Nanohaloarchaea archaeon]
MKLMALNSGGIDSPAAMHMMLAQGHELEAVIFDLAPFTDEADVDTAVETVEQLEEEHETDIPTHVVPHGFVQERFLDEVEEDAVAYNCLFSRRTMLRTAEQLAEERGADGLVTGESLGQVASQTLDNIVVTGSAVDMQVYRPLIGLDKLEIEAVAKEAGTYDTSTQGGIQCAAVIEYPETHGKVAEMERIEEQFDVAGMVEKSLEQAEAV